MKLLKFRQLLRRPSRCRCRPQTPRLRTNVPTPRACGIRFYDGSKEALNRAVQLQLETRLLRAERHLDASDYPDSIRNTSPISAEMLHDIARLTCAIGANLLFRTIITEINYTDQLPKTPCLFSNSRRTAVSPSTTPGVIPPSLPDDSISDGLDINIRYSWKMRIQSRACPRFRNRTVREPVVSWETLQRFPSADEIREDEFINRAVCFSAHLEPVENFIHVNDEL